MLFVITTLVAIIVGLAAIGMLYLLWSGQDRLSGADTEGENLSKSAICSICEDNGAMTRINGEPVCSECKEEYYIMED
ncbi:hypothetical protein K0C01_11365 [Salinarchaeum sp. IM2453]|uniref:hypothetical protein n=1 Tax=Salinarchaeum sp. IM2453 TaxID=2862870 RepID=UPI001C82830A|nr:hypothetical protein [Salinarchaeum sp. IM2453]QZA88370.1 hypothetical protein K0C01_11365 [Salinarchaeum sp. IM2453]